MYCSLLHDKLSAKFERPPVVCRSLTDVLFEEDRFVYKQNIYLTAITSSLNKWLKLDPLFQIHVIFVVFDMWQS